MKRILAIGSEGNIGKSLCTYLINKQYEVYKTDIKQGWKNNYAVADINNSTDFIPIFNNFKPDCVILLAAMVSRVTCEQASSLSVQTNLSGVNNIIQLCKIYNCKLVYFSTSEVYGPNDNIMSEQDMNLHPNNRYGLTKLLGEYLIKYEVDNYNLKSNIIRPFMIYDENEDIGDHRSAMIRFASNLGSDKYITVHKGSKRG